MDEFDKPDNQSNNDPALYSPYDDLNDPYSKTLDSQKEANEKINEKEKSTKSSDYEKNRKIENAIAQIKSKKSCVFVSKDNIKALQYIDRKKEKGSGIGLIESRRVLDKNTMDKIITYLKIPEKFTLSTKDNPIIFVNNGEVFLAKLKNRKFLFFKRKPKLKIQKVDVSDLDIKDSALSSNKEIEGKESLDNDKLKDSAPMEGNGTLSKNDDANKDTRASIEPEIDNNETEEVENSKRTELTKESFTEKFEKRKTTTGSQERMI